MKRREFLINAYKIGGLAALYSLGITHAEAASLQDKLKGVLAKKNAVASNWYDGADLYCGWEEGATRLNTGATNEFVWDVSNGTGTSRNTTAPLFGAADLSWTGTASGSYVYEDFADLTEFAIRYRSKLITNGLTTASDFVDQIVFRNVATTESVAAFRFRNVGGTLYYSFIYENNADGVTVNNGISLSGIEADEFQVEIRWNRATPILGIKLWNIDGTSQIGSTIEVTDISTTNVLDRFFNGAFGATVTASTTYRTDNIAIFLDGDVYPGPEL